MRARGHEGGGARHDECDASRRQFDHRSDEDGVDHGILPGSRQRREMRARLMCDEVGQRSTRDARAARLREGSMRSSPAHMRRRTRSSPPRRALSGSGSERHEGPLLLGSGRCSVTTASARKVLILGWNETSLVGPSYARASAALNCRRRDDSRRGKADGRSSASGSSG